jgi:HAD superfamily phosphoserine phosphatase-like hydrolase
MATSKHPIPPRTFAVFDVDGTLHDGSLGTEFIVELSRQGFVTEPIHDKYNEWQQATDKSAFFMEHFYQAFSALKPITRREMEQVGRTVAEYAYQHIRPCMLAEIRKHQEAGRILLIISTSPSVAVAPLATMLGFDDWYTPPTPFDDTDMYAGPVHRSPEEKNKAFQLDLLTTKHSLMRAGSSAYGDTLDDLPLLEAVTYPFAVTPTTELRDIAHTRHWPIISL